MGYDTIRYEVDDLTLDRADVGEIPDDGRVVYDEPYLSTYAQREAPQNCTSPADKKEPRLR